MRKATLYTLQAHEVLCAQDFVEMKSLPIQQNNHEPSWAKVKGYGEWVTPADPQTLRLPLHEVSRISKPHFLPISDPMGLPKGETYFFAVEPALREILESPFKSKLSSLTNEVADLRHQLSYAKDKGLRDRRELLETQEKWAKLEAAVFAHNSKPWWQRLFSSKVLEF